MKEFIEKLIGRLVESVSLPKMERMESRVGKKQTIGFVFGVRSAVRIINELTEEYDNGWAEQLLEAKKNCGEDSDCSECPFGQIEDRCILAELQIDTDKNGWIPVSERLPEESLNSVLGWDEYRNRCCFVQYISGRWVLGNDIDSVKIIAWQLLPTPYKEGCE
jgi:hypothetical protein